MRSGGEMDASAFVSLLIQHPEKGLSDIMSEFGLSREDVAGLTKDHIVRDTLDDWLGATMRPGWPSCPRCQGRAQENRGGGLPDGPRVDILINLSPEMLRKELAGRIALLGCTIHLPGHWVCERCQVSWSDTLDER